MLAGMCPRTCGKIAQNACWDDRTKLCATRIKACNALASWDANKKMVENALAFPRVCTGSKKNCAEMFKQQKEKP